MLLIPLLYQTCGVDAKNCRVSIVCLDSPKHALTDVMHILWCHVHAPLLHTNYRIFNFLILPLSHSRMLMTFLTLTHSHSRMLMTFLTLTHSPSLSKKRSQRYLYYYLYLTLNNTLYYFSDNRSWKQNLMMGYMLFLCQKRSLLF